MYDLVLKTVTIMLTMILLSVVTIVSNAQDYYAGKDVLEYKDAKYKITHYSFTRDIIVENQDNCMRDKLRYKIGSDPVVYYSDATGMGHFADSDSSAFNRIVKEVFQSYTLSGDVLFSKIIK